MTRPALPPGCRPSAAAASKYVDSEISETRLRPERSAIGCHCAHQLRERSPLWPADTDDGQVRAEIIELCHAVSPSHSRGAARCIRATVTLVATGGPALPSPRTTAARVPRPWRPMSPSPALGHSQRGRHLSATTRLVIVESQVPVSGFFGRHSNVATTIACSINGLLGAGRGTN